MFKANHRSNRYLGVIIYIRLTSKKQSFALRAPVPVNYCFYRRFFIIANSVMTYSARIMESYSSIIIYYHRVFYSEQICIPIQLKPSWFLSAIYNNTTRRVSCFLLYQRALWLAGSLSVHISTWQLRPHRLIAGKLNYYNIIILCR